MKKTQARAFADNRQRETKAPVFTHKRFAEAAEAIHKRPEGQHGTDMAGKVVLAV